MTQPTDYSLTYRAALNYLTRRDHSEFELAQKLTNKKHASTTILAVIEDLKRANYLNDQRFAERYCHFRRERGFGPLRIIAELQARGISSETIAQVIQIADNEWLIAAHHLWRKRFKGKRPDDFTRRAKQMRFLQYRGFTREQIDNALNSDR